MRTPLALLKFVAKAALNVAGAGVLGDFVVDVLPEVAQDVWNRWSRASSEAERNEEIQRIAQASAAEMRDAAEEVAREVAAGCSEQVQRVLASYLTRLQPVVRRTLRRPSDPAGTSVPAAFSIRSARDVMRLLPDRSSRFQPGDRPIPSVDWELVELLGVGGFGEVWKARNPHVPNAPPVALKFCLDESAARALRREAAIDNRLLAFHPPGVVRLLHTYLSHDPPCLEYEFVQGGDLAGLLAEWQAKKGRIEPEQAARVVLRLARILAVVHHQQPPIVHRDLKPANILVQLTTPGKFDLRIADFGIGGLAASQQIREAARGRSAASLSMSSLRGSHTPLYASPEQMRGGDPDPRDDVHALGVIWYQMLTGELDRGAPTGLDWPDELRERGMSDQQIQLLGSCFSSRPERRPADAGQLAESIQRLFFASGAKTDGDQPPDRPKTESPDTSRACPARRVSTVSSQPQRDQSVPQVLINSIGMQLAYIPAGEFLMGSPEAEHDRGTDEMQHRVRITKPFYLGVYPVTQAEYERVTGKNPSAYCRTGSRRDQVAGQDTSRFPVESVSWKDAVEFCRKLSALPAERDSGGAYRLPTEAEWEYACRAGTQTQFSFGDDSKDLGAYAWFGGNSGGAAHPVGQKKPNGWGLYDMHGNVWEWCQDWYAAYPQDSVTDPEEPSGGSLRVYRGGGWGGGASDCRAASRSWWYRPGYRYGLLGFRLVKAVS